MIEDARKIPDGHVVETDVCVIGGGPAGLTLAKALRQSQLSVCVLESGGLEPDPEIQALYDGESVGRPYFALGACRTRQFGGSSNCWAGMCHPLAPIDFEARDWVPHSGWPFDRAHLQPYYVRAHRILRLGEFDFDATRWQDREHPLLPTEGPLVSGVFRISKPALRLGVVWRALFEKARRVRVLLNATATHLALDPSGRTMAGVTVRCLEGPTFQVRARRYVLATGGIENARMLLASDDVHKTGIGNAHDLVGRYFMEHPHTDDEGLYLGSPKAPTPSFYRGHWAGKRKRIWGAFEPPAAVLRAERILNFAIVFLPFRVPKGDGTLHDVARAIAETDAGRRPSDPLAVYTFGTPTEQAPNPDSRVTLGADRDALGVRRARLDWRLTALDKRTLVRAHALLAQTMGRAGLGRVKLTVDPDEVTWPKQTHGGYHHMGTTRMSADPKRGVVDARGYVHGVDNLIVAGSSVFPTSGAANPTMTIMALALRTAEHLEGVLR